MEITGCDFHPSWQQIALVDDQTGEVMPWWAWKPAATASGFWICWSVWVTSLEGRRGPDPGQLCAPAEDRQARRGAHLEIGCEDILRGAREPLGNQESSALREAALIEDQKELATLLKILNRVRDPWRKVPKIACSYVVCWLSGLALHNAPGAPLHSARLAKTSQAHSLEDAGRNEQIFACAQRNCTVFFCVHLDQELSCDAIV